MLTASISFADFQQELRRYSYLLWSREDVISLLQNLQADKHTKERVLIEIKRLRATDSFSEDGSIKEDSSIDIDIRVSNILKEL